MKKDFFEKISHGTGVPKHIVIIAIVAIVTVLLFWLFDGNLFPGTKNENNPKTMNKWKTPSSNDTIVREILNKSGFILKDTKEEVEKPDS